MFGAMKILIFIVALLAAAFFANHLGFVSIPWLDINSVPTYSDDAVRSEGMLKKIFED
jgi:hypothetical protein